MAESISISIGNLDPGIATTDDYLVFVDNSDNKTKKSPISSLPVGSGDMLKSAYDPANINQQVVGTTATQTLSNKTLTTPTIAKINGFEITATGAGGIEIENSAGTATIITGAGGSTGTSIVGTTNIASASADYHQLTGGTGIITDTATGSSTNISINLIPKGTGRVQANTVNIPTISSTDTLTNKTLISTTNVISENTTTASSATPTPTGGSLRNYFTVTALAAGATFSAPSGTPVDGNLLMVRIKDNGTARTLAWNAIYRGGDTSLPTTTILSKTMFLLFVYNGADAKWDLVSKEDNH